MGGTAYQDFFARVECKYLLTSRQYEALLPDVEEMASVDQYGRTRILNIYYDTPDYRLIRTSLERPSYKEKLRLRSYGIPQEDTQVYLEIKKKYAGIVYKRRIGLPCVAAEESLSSGLPLPEKEPSQIGREIEYFRKCHRGLRPAMVISCSRVALAGITDPLLRITFDEDIRWRTEGLDLMEGGEGEPLLQEGEHLMELKFDKAIPLPLARRMSELGIRKATFSKYGMGYRALCAQRKEKTSCQQLFSVPSYQTASSQGKGSFSAQPAPC